MTHEKILFFFDNYCYYQFFSLISDMIAVVCSFLSILWFFILSSCVFVCVCLFVRVHARAFISFISVSLSLAQCECLCLSIDQKVSLALMRLLILLLFQFHFVVVVFSFFSSLVIIFCYHKTNKVCILLL